MGARRDDFVHLHLHTEYSLLDGAARVEQVVGRAAELGQPAIAITDHGVLYGAVEFFRTAKAAGLNPIIGMEAYLTPGSRFDRPTRAEDVRYHMTLLAENEIGYHNLLQLSSRAFLDGYYYKPRVDNELLAAHSAGLIATSGCLGGPVAQRLAPDASREEGIRGGAPDFAAAKRAAGLYQDIFGQSNFFIEVQDHGIDAERRVLPDLVRIATEIGAPLLATNDSHYTHPHEAEAHDVLLCIQTGSTRDEPGRFAFNGSGYYLKTAAEMGELFPADQFPGACSNTVEVGERVKVSIEFGRSLLPRFQVPAGESEESYLAQLVQAGARRRYGDQPDPDVEARIATELRVIAEMGFPAYFLIVWDLIRFAKDRGIRTGPGRGSAAGSIVAYCLGITGLDPLHHGLIFERFLNPGRHQLPDIDMDFDERYRGDVIRYCAERYGTDHVAQIITFATIKGRQAVRDSARVLGYPYSLGDRVAKLMPPPILGVEATLAQSLEAPGPEADPSVADFYRSGAGLRDAIKVDPEVRRVVETARGLEGLRRQDSIHAAAVVISPVPLVEIVPVQRKGEQGELVTQFEMGAIEALGLLKMDFLGLRNLSTMERTLELVEEATGHRIDLDSVPLDDPRVYAMLQRGDSIGVFQLEGSAMRVLMRQLRPDRFSDLVALVALYRPGPMGAGMHHEYADRKNGRTAVSYPHPALESILGETYGIMVFQEQVMQVAQTMAGYSMADADTLRKAMGKKIPEVMAEQQAEFEAGCQRNGHSARLGRQLFELIVHFAGYGFNKSHAAAYALVAYQTAWLKAHYPAEYMAALLTSTKRDKDRTALYLNECRSLGIRVLTPSVNHSEADFVARQGEIPFGLSAIRNVGDGVVESVLLERKKNGLFQDFQDFANRVEPNVLNKRTVESLIKAGAFDGIAPSRRGLFGACEQMLEATLERRRAEDMGQFSLFGGANASINSVEVEVSGDEWETHTKLAFEKEMLGLYVSDHPLLGLGGALAAAVSHSILDLWDVVDQSQVTAGGIVTGLTRRYTKNGEPMLFFRLEDMEAGIEVACFPKLVAEAGPLIREDAVITVGGRLDHRGDSVKLVAAQVRELRAIPAVRIVVDSVALSQQAIERLKGVLSNHPGPTEVHLHISTDTAGRIPTVVRLGDDYRVETTGSLLAEIRELFGPRALI